ncbi:MAG: hypothetical protein JO323_15805 [Acidobacteriia bacterium]|nr:hypothetical protein [Terriglobia bacterium]
MNRIVFPALLAFAFVTGAPGAEQGQLDSSVELFTVMAAINAAGYSADLSSPNNHPLRDKIRAELAKENIPSLEGIKSFFNRHRKHTDAEELAQYISFALSMGPPPTFVSKTRDVDLPPDVQGMQELVSLLAAFYQEAKIAEKWQSAQPAIEDYLVRYHGPVSEAVLQVNSYLRQQTSGFQGRHFQIYIELLAGPNEIQTRSYANEYTIVVTPSPEPRIFDVRHAYLHYLLDPLATRYHEILDRKKPIADHAKRAAALDASFKDDFLLLATESMIKAIEAKLDHHPAGIQEALRQGYILTPFFSEYLPIYEKQERAMLFYYPELVGAIDLKTEDQRLSQVVFDKEPPVRAAVKTAPPPEPAPLTGPAKTLEDAEQAYTARDLNKAKNLYLAVLQETDEQKLHGSAYYGLARIAALQKDPEAANKLFQKTIDLRPEPQIEAWALVYLGRLAMAAGERDEASRYFQTALKVEGASQAAQQAASQGLAAIPKP